MPSVGEQIILPRAGVSTKICRYGPNHRTSNPNRPYSNLVEGISECLLGKGGDGANMTFGTSLEASVIDIMS